MLLAGLGAVAALAPAKHAEPVTRDPTIGCIAPRQRQEAQDAQPRPRRPKPFRHADRAFRLQPGDAIGEKDGCLIAHGVEPVVAEEGLAQRRRGRQKAESLSVVVAQDEARPAGAERTMAIEDEDRMIVREHRHALIIAIAIGFSCRRSVHPHPLVIARNSSSLMVATPSARAFSAFEPASAPTTRKSVLPETLPLTLAPSASARAFASERDSEASVPVKTIVFPESGESAATRPPT